MGTSAGPRRPRAAHHVCPGPLSPRALSHPSVRTGPGIVHLGLRNFARAHTAVYTAAALAREPGPWGVVGVAQPSHSVADPLIAQDLPYTVPTLTPAGIEATIPAVLVDVIVAADSPEELVGHLASATTRIVTLTVAEKGHSYANAARAPSYRSHSRRLHRLPRHPGGIRQLRPRERARPRRRATRRFARTHPRRASSPPNWPTARPLSTL
jgi:mannitol-1-phosphate/altronate dehydrogenase